MVDNPEVIGCSLIVQLPQFLTSNPRKSMVLFMRHSDESRQARPSPRFTVKVESLPFPASCGKVKMKSALPLVLSSMVAAFCGLASGPLPQKRRAHLPPRWSIKRSRKVPVRRIGMPLQMERFGEMVAGEWILEGRAAPSSLDSKARFEKGRTVIKFGPAQLSLIENMHTRSDSGVVDDALGIFWWDKEAQGYPSAFCDSADPNGCSVYERVGRWEGDHLVFHFMFVVNGKRQRTNEVIGRTGPDSFTAILTHPDTDGAETQPFTWKHIRAVKSRSEEK